MVTGIPKERKDLETRVGLTPVGVKSLTGNGHRILVESNAGRFSGFADEDFVAAGRQICDTGAEVWSRAEMVIKVKE